MGALHLGLRVGGGIALYSALGLPRPRGRLWLVPLRDSVSFAMWILSFLGTHVRWSGRRLRVDTQGRLHPITAADHPAPVRHESVIPDG
jgi:ceramide glucosyltransferase